MMTTVVGEIALKRFSHIAAKEKNGGIGYKHGLPWPRLPLVSSLY